MSGIHVAVARAHFDRIKPNKSGSVGIFYLSGSCGEILLISLFLLFQVEGARGEHAFPERTLGRWRDTTAICVKSGSLRSVISADNAGDTGMIKPPRPHCRQRLVDTAAGRSRRGVFPDEAVQALQVPADRRRRSGAKIVWRAEPVKVGHCADIQVLPEGLRRQAKVALLPALPDVGQQGVAGSDAKHVNDGIIERTALKSG
jgi:hypothetical protein